MSQFAARANVGSLLPDDDLREMECIAVELARMAGAEIQTAFGSLLAVKYKDKPADDSACRDPVSAVDRRVEAMICARLAEHFPDHDIIGEEIDQRPACSRDIVWAIDPVDGATNFANGFPLFAASIGVLHRGRPIVGALWCATSHALRAGVYHTRRGHPLCFEGEPLDPKPNPAVRRRIGGASHVTTQATFPWEGRITGSAALECAFVAASILGLASFEQPNLWDVAGGVALVEAAGGEIWMLGDSEWEPFERFEAMAGEGGSAKDLRNWRAPMIVGERDAVVQLCRIAAE